MQRKTRIIIGVVVGVVAVAAIVGVIALNIVNNRAEQEIARNIDESIAASGMEEAISYDDITVKSAQGTVEIRGFTIDDPAYPTKLRADLATITVPAGEAAAYARQPEAAEFSEVAVAVEGETFDDSSAASAVTVGTLTAKTTGVLSARTMNGTRTPPS